MSRLKSEPDSGFSSKIRTFPPNSGRLDTLLVCLFVCLFFLGGGPRACFPGKKNRNLRSSNCWKCTEIVNPTITASFLYHCKSFTIPSGEPFNFGEGTKDAKVRAAKVVGVEVTGGQYITMNEYC